MKKLSFVFAAIILGLGAASMARSGHQPVPGKIPEKLARAKLEAAQRTYDVVWKNYKEGLVPAGELVYRWSRRWLEAELDSSDKKSDRLSAYRAHQQRIRELTRVARNRFQIRVSTVDESNAADFFSAEADIWVEQAK